MRDPARIDRITELFKYVWRAYPDMRFGQLIDYLQMTAEKAAEGTPLFYLEDTEWEPILQDILDQTPSRRTY